MARRATLAFATAKQLAKNSKELRKLEAIKIKLDNLDIPTLDTPLEDMLAELKDFESSLNVDDLKTFNKLNDNIEKISYMLDKKVAQPLHQITGTLDSSTPFQTFKQRKLIRDKKEKQLQSIEDKLEENKSQFTTNYDYKKMMEAVSECIKEIKELRNKNMPSEPYGTTTALEKAYYLFVGEIEENNLSYGALRVAQIFTWISDRLEDSKNMLKQLAKIKNLKKLQDIYLPQENDWEETINWLNNLSNEHPFSLEHNVTGMKKCIETAGVALQLITDRIQNIDLTLNNVDKCTAMLKQFKLIDLERIKNLIPQLEAEKYFTNDKININSFDLDYLENTFIPKYEKSFNTLIEIADLNKTAAPYTTSFMKSAITVCKHIIDSLHSIKIENDPVMKSRVARIKDKILGHYDHITALYKAMNKNNHAWINEFNDFLLTLNNCLSHFANDNNKDLEIFIEDITSFIENYIIFWHLENDQNIKNKLNECLSIINNIRSALDIKLKSN